MPDNFLRQVRTCGLPASDERLRSIRRCFAVFRRRLEGPLALPWRRTGIAAIRCQPAAIIGAL
jgi:hypothetical protein